MVNSLEDTRSYSLKVASVTSKTCMNKSENSSHTKKFYYEYETPIFCFPLLSWTGIMKHLFATWYSNHDTMQMIEYFFHIAGIKEECIYGIKHEYFGSGIGLERQQHQPWFCWSYTRGWDEEDMVNGLISIVVSKIKVTPKERC